MTHPDQPAGARPLSEWHEEIGPVLWWKFPINEPPYVGTPLDLGETVEVTLRAYGVDKLMRGMVGAWPGYHTHWTPIPLPAEALPRASQGGVEQSASPKRHPVDECPSCKTRGNIWVTERHRTYYVKCWNCMFSVNRGSREGAIQAWQEASPPPLGAGEGGGDGHAARRADGGADDSASGPVERLAAASSPPSAPPTPPQLLACPRKHQADLEWRGAGWFCEECEQPVDIVFRAPLPAAVEGKEGGPISLMMHTVGLTDLDHFDSAGKTRATVWLPDGLYRSGKRVEVAEGAEVVKPCDDQELQRELYEALSNARTGDGYRFSDIMDEVGLRNGVLQITEGSNALDKLVARHTAALAAQVETLTRDREDASDRRAAAEASLSAMGEKVGKMEAVVKAARRAVDPDIGDEEGLVEALTTLSTAAAEGETR